MQVYITLALLYWKLVSSTDSESGDFPSEKYQSYLQFPRISFGGRFRAYVATGNNVPKNYDNENFFHYDRFGSFQGGKNQWNAEGTNDFLLINCYVTSACHLDGRCTEEASVDKICGNRLTDSEFSSFAKMVDIDTAFQAVPEIWGMKLRVPGFFHGELRPSPLHFSWARGAGSGDSGTSVMYQSTVRNISWEAGADSSLTIKQMQERMQYLGSVELSITYTLDSYKIEGSKNFAMGRILGVIGILGPLAPQVSVWGRSLAPLFPLSEDSTGGTENGTVVHTNHAPFIVDKKRGNLHICFLNGLRTGKGGIPINFPNGTKIGYFLKTKEMRHFLFPSGSCNESVVAIADISVMNMTNIMLKFGGVVDIDLTEEQVKVLSYTSLSVFQSIGDSCNNVFMQEYKDGLRVRSYENWVYRLENGQQISHKLFATKFGKPAQGINISIVPSENGIDPVESTGYQEPRPFTKIIKSTDKNGIANFVFPTRSSNHYIRTGIDGNIEGYTYAIVNSSMSILSRNVLDRFIAARVYHNHSYPNEPTWTDHVLPIFQQYANMFPCMRNRGFDLSNYFDVVDHKEILRLSMSLPIGHPSYMPATRDMGQVKKDMILRWLSKDVPPYGDARKLLTKHYLLDLLQTALEVTHATMPPLLTALWSIKKGYNRNIRRTLIQILDQERYKIDIIARIMLSLGGRPKIFHGSFVLSYPSSLPNGIDKDQMLSLEMLSLHLLRKGAALTRPETSNMFLWFKKAIFTHAAANRRCHHQCKRQSSKCCKYWSYLRIQKEKQRERCRSAVNAFLKTSLQNLKPEKSYNPYEDPQQRKIFNYHSSVDNFFHHILAVLSFTTNCGSNNTIFQRSKLKKSSTYRNLKSYDYFSAVNDVRHIMRITNSIYEDSQHNLLSSIVEDKCNPPSSMSCNPFSGGVRKAPNNILDNLRSRSYHSYNDAPPYSIWSIVPNMKTMVYPKSKGKDLVRAFNDVYTFYLMAYEKVLNALSPESMHKHRNLLKELERAFHVMGHRIVQTPLNKHANKHAGPNMAPTFEVDFEIARTRFLEDKGIIDELKQVNWNLGRYNKIRKQYMKLQPGSAFAKQHDIVFQDEAEQHLSDAYDVYQPLYKNRYIDLYAKYNDLPVR